MTSYRQVPELTSRMEPHEYGVWILKHDAMDLIRLGSRIIELIERITPQGQRLEEQIAKAITEWEDKIKTA